MSEDGSILGQDRKMWTLPLPDFQRRLGFIPEGWHLVAVDLNAGEVKVVAFPDQRPP